VVLDHPLIAERYFFPRPAPLPEPTWVETPAGRLGCYAHRPHGDAARTVLHFHGNGEVVADYLDWAPELFARLGVNLFLAEYRGYGASEGEPRLAAMLEDASLVFEALALPPEQVVVFGRSVGSIYAIEVASRYPVGGLILESGIADPLERVLLRVTPEELGATLEDVQAAASRVLDHQRKLRDFEGRLLVLHAEHDHLVDVSHARRNHEWATQAAERELVILPHGDHNSILPANGEAYLAALGRFLAG
jgi:pimeloyl-ACP methyl ester carboxylesterase